MNKIETEDIKELFAEWGLWSLVDDISPDGDGHGDNLQLTKEGLEAERMINLLLSDQSQKQPEEKCIHYFPLSSEGVCQKCGIKFEDIKSEKQEEWRKEWRKLSFEIGSITKHQADEIEGFISERIKEAREEGRTDVLERLEKWSTNPQQGVFYDVGCNYQERLLRFLSKLLKEEK